MSNCGIYEIKNIINGNSYIGQTVNLAARKRQHYSELRRNKHYNGHLQKAVNLYGLENFRFNTLLICESQFLTYYEQAIVDTIMPVYNICRECVDSVKGVLVGRKLPDEHKYNISVAQTGKKHPVSTTEEAKKNRAKGQIGKHHTNETKKKLSDYFKGRPWSENRERVAMSEEAKLHLSDHFKGRPWPESRKQHIVSEETKHKQSIAMKESYAKRRLAKAQSETESIT